MDAGLGLGLLGAFTSLAGGITSIAVGFREARELERRAITEARRIRRAGDRVLGAQTAAYAHAGVTQQGTPQDVRNDTIAEIERDVFRMSQGYEAQANQAIGIGIMSFLDSTSTSVAYAAGAGTGKTFGYESSPTALMSGQKLGSAGSRYSQVIGK
jgi:hypothetical protein